MSEKSAENALKTKIWQNIRNKIFDLDSVIYVTHFKLRKNDMRKSKSTKVNNSEALLIILNVCMTVNRIETIQD